MNPQQVRIDIEQTDPVICAHCKSPFFTEDVIIRKVSKFVTGDPEDTILPIPVLVCRNCGAVCVDAVRPELRSLFKIPTPSVEQDTVKLEDKPQAKVVPLIFT